MSNVETGEILPSERHYTDSGLEDDSEAALVVAPVEVQVKDDSILDLANDEEDPVALVQEAKKDE